MTRDLTPGPEADAGRSPVVILIPLYNDWESLAVLAPLLDEDGSELVGRHTIRFDYLVIAVGSVTNDFGIAGVADHCMFLDDRAGVARVDHEHDP